MQRPAHLPLSHHGQKHARNKWAQVGGGGGGGWVRWDGWLGCRECIPRSLPTHAHLLPAHMHTYAAHASPPTHTHPPTRSTTGMLFYNSMLSLPMLLLAVVVKGEPFAMGTYPLLWNPQARALCVRAGGRTGQAGSVVGELPLPCAQRHSPADPRPRPLAAAAVPAGTAAGVGAGADHQPLHLCVHPRQ